MTELEKLEAGLEYCYDDAEVSARKENAIIQCRKYNAIDDTESEGFLLIKDCLRIIVKRHGISDALP